MNNRFTKNLEGGMQKPPSVGDIVHDGAQLPVGKRRGRMTIVGDNSIEFGSFTLTAVGLVVQEDSVPTYENWWDMLLFVARVYGTIQFLMGDILIYGQRVHGKTYQEVADGLGLDKDTIAQWVWVCRAVDLSIRIDKLSYTHHLHVAGLEPDYQAKWLAYALEKGLSAAALKKELQGNRPALTGQSVWGNKTELNIVKRMATWTPDTFKEADAGRRAELKQEIEVVTQRLMEFYRWCDG